MFESFGFNSADVLACIAIIIGIVIGFRQGLSGQMTILLTALGIGFAMLHGFIPCRDWLMSHFALSPDAAGLMARVILVVVPLLAGMLIYLLLRHLLKITFTTWVDRIGGAIAGGVVATGVVLLVFILLNTIPAAKRPALVNDTSWINREVIGGETQFIREVISRVEKGESMIENARETHATKREKWDN
jgi:uncharacterized membrane protein required for colicin V production